MFHNDFETRSLADLEEVGSHRYGEDPSTEALMLAIARDHHEPVLWINPRHGWSVDQDEANELLRAQMVSDEEIWAHSYDFEDVIWKHRGRPDLRQEPPDYRRLRCTAALARVAGLPAALDMIGQVLGLSTKKSKEGKELIKHFSIPTESGTFNSPKAYREAFARFGAYCVQDVRVEQAVHRRLRDFELTGDLLATFQMDREVNHRGIPINRPALENAVRILDQAAERGLEQFLELTGIRPTQREKVRTILYGLGVSLKDMKAETVKKALEAEELLPANRAILESYQLLQFAAVKKVKTMLACACSDNRLRGMLLFYGTKTGRWSGRKTQPQNMKTPKHKQSGLVFEMIEQGRSAEDIELIFPNAVEEVSNCIRHMVPGPLYHADYAAIEARGVCWLAGQEDVLEMFRRGEDLYLVMASRIYGRTVTKADSDKRKVGKTTFLGCGYQMGVDRFYNKSIEDRLPGMTRELAATCVQSYRSLCPKVKALWWRFDEAARYVITTKKEQRVGEKLLVRHQVKAGIPYLLVDLPTGRSIHYPWPMIEDGDITFFGKLGQKGGKNWGRVKTYGGAFCENATQAICTADLTAHGAKQAIAKGYPVFTLTHDDAMAEKRPGLSAEEFGRLLATPPKWAAGLPIKAEAHELPYYTKV